MRFSIEQIIVYLTSGQMLPLAEYTIKLIHTRDLSQSITKSFTPHCTTYDRGTERASPCSEASWLGELERLVLARPGGWAPHALPCGAGGTGFLWWNFIEFHEWRMDRLARRAVGGVALVAACVCRGQCLMFAHIRRSLTSWYSWGVGADVGRVTRSQLLLDD